MINKIYKKIAIVGLMMFGISGLCAASIGPEEAERQYALCEETLKKHKKVFEEFHEKSLGIEIQYIPHPKNFAKFLGKDFVHYSNTTHL